MMKKRVDFTTAQLLGYSVICNNYIHTAQIKYIRKILHGDKEKMRVVQDVILGKNEIKYDAGEQTKHISALPSKEQERLKRVIMELMCYDGKFDETEERMFDELFGGESSWKKLYSQKYLTKFNRKILKKTNIASRKVNSLNKKIQCSDFIEDSWNAIESLMVGLKNKTEFLGVYEKLKSNFLNNISSETEPTVALVGKTMAGKSSLFSLLCGEFEEFIGVGTQRTTKYTMVTHIKGIRFFDTPGLSASSRLGREDEKKTMESIRQADLICFLVASDSVAENTLQYLKRISGVYEKIHVIINYKNGDNFLYAQPHREFLENPKKWSESNGKESLQGNINRIQRYAKKEGFEQSLVYHKIYIHAAEQAKFVVRRRTNNKILSIPLHMKKKIYTASGYPQLKKDIISDILENFCEYRIDKLLHFEKKIINTLNDEFTNKKEILNCEMERKQQKRKESLDYIESLKEKTLDREKSCVLSYFKKMFDLYTDSEYDEWKQQYCSITRSITKDTQKNLNEYENDIIEYLKSDVDVKISQYGFSFRGINNNVPEEQKKVLGEWGTLASKIGLDLLDGMFKMPGLNIIGHFGIDAAKKKLSNNNGEKKTKIQQDREIFLQKMSDSIQKDVEKKVTKNNEYYKNVIREQSYKSIELIEIQIKEIKHILYEIERTEKTIQQAYEKTVL